MSKPHRSFDLGAESGTGFSRLPAPPALGEEVRRVRKSSLELATGSLSRKSSLSKKRSTEEKDEEIIVVSAHSEGSRTPPIGGPNTVGGRGYATGKRSSHRSSRGSNLFPPPSSTRSAQDAFLAATKATANLVQVKLVYIKYVADVDTLRQSYSASIGLDMIWEASADEIRRFENDSAKYKPNFVPAFEFPNAKSCTQTRKPLVNGSHFKILHGKKGRNGGDKFNFMRTVVDGVFMHEFELQNFPFDCQDLAITIDATFSLKEEMLFVPWNESFDVMEGEPPAGVPENSFVQYNSEFSSIPEFDCKRVLCEFAVKNNSWGRIVLRFQMARIWQGIIYRIAFLTCLLTCMSLTVFSFHPEDNLVDRLNFLLTNILALVAFMFVVQSSLPATPYLTLLDTYNSASFLFICILLITLALLAKADMVSELREVVDVYVLIFGTGFLVILQCYFLVQSVLARKHETAKFKMTAAEMTRMKNPIMVAGRGLLEEAAKTRNGDPFLSFQGSQKQNFVM